MGIAAVSPARSARCDPSFLMYGIQFTFASNLMPTTTAILCPGQGAQSVGMGKAWHDASAAARRVFAEADAILAPRLGATLSDLCFNGPADRLNQTDVAQPAIFVVSVACLAGLRERGELGTFAAAAGLSLGEYTALHLAQAFSFADGLRLVAERGRLMQEAALASHGGMVAVVGADEPGAQAVCVKALAASAPGEVLVCANFNAPGQIVLSGHATACDRAVTAAGELGFRATKLAVAGAFHSPLMQPAADRMAEHLAKTTLKPWGGGGAGTSVAVWSNVTGEPHSADDMELLKRRLVEQIVQPVRWAECCATLLGWRPPHSGVDEGKPACHELAPGNVLKGLMRRIDRSCEVINHDQPDLPAKT